MKLTRKKLLFAGIGFIVLLAAIILAARFIPFTKILKIASTPETDFVNQEQIRSQAPHALFFDFEINPQTGNSTGLYKGIARSGI